MKELAFGFVVAAAGLDIAANMLLQKSDGFRKVRYALPAIIMVCLAFTLLAKATKVMDLTIAYVSWGALAIIGTVACARVFLGQKLNHYGVAGVILILASIVIMETA